MKLVLGYFGKGLFIYGCCILPLSACTERPKNNKIELAKIKSVE